MRSHGQGLVLALGWEYISALVIAKLRLFPSTVASEMMGTHLSPPPSELKVGHYRGKKLLSRP